MRKMTCLFWAFASINKSSCKGPIILMLFDCIFC
jgi:hypothetical protein